MNDTPQPKTTLAGALKNLSGQVRLLAGEKSAAGLVLSSNCTLGRERPTDPGVVAYFMFDGQQVAIPCDRWIYVEQNVQAISLTIESMRAIERHGAKHMVKAMFQGFAALPAPEDWRGILGHPVSLDQAETAYRSKMYTAHPDRGGSNEAAARGRPSVGLATLVAYWLAHRQADVLGLTWSSLDSTERVLTRKTKVSLPVNVDAYPELAAMLAETRARQQADADACEPKRIPPAHVIVNERTGRPYTAATFQHLWREIAAEAGISAELQFRDIRATAVTELCDSGADIIPMSTHTGHKTAQMSRRYARPTAEQFTRAAGDRVAFLAKGKRAK